MPALPGRSALSAEHAALMHECPEWQNQKPQVR
jgi:hypothetical protein